ncbi:tubulin epsilon and delta complex protein 2 isoform X4 [Papio anubis]|uniref:tubulin epsilon and delta complex protein 2 isoform X4 n=1 Tax=Papio anubis TaxID=9555 RepID=UPI0012AE2F85|nr:tubulin epsilon and delta complex protein 2 isoform X4 [Papio anubis]
MLPADCSRRLVAELQGALDACAQRQLQLEQSLRVCRRLLQAWEPPGTWTWEPPPEPETNEEDPLPACTPSPQDLKELEFLTQALEKAVRVRRGITKAGERNKAPSLKSRSIVTSPGTTASTPPQSPGQAGGHASDTRPTKGLRQTTVPAKGRPERQLPSVRDRTRAGIGARAPRPGAGLRNQHMAPSAAPQAPEAFTLKEKGHLLRLPAAFRKAASQNSSLWVQLSSMQTSDSMDAAAAKTQFLQNIQTAVSLLGLWEPGGPLALNLAVRRVPAQAQCCGSGGGGEAPAEGLFAAETACEGGTLSSPNGLDAGVPLPAHAGGPAGHGGPVSAEAAGTACRQGKWCRCLGEPGKQEKQSRGFGCHPKGHILLCTQRWRNGHHYRVLWGGPPEPRRPVGAEQSLHGAPSCLSTPAPRSCRPWRPSSCEWPCWTSRSTWKRS